MKVAYFLLIIIFNDFLNIYELIGIYDPIKFYNLIKVYDSVRICDFIKVYKPIEVCNFVKNCSFTIIYDAQ
ncbi:hypothetical protein [Peptoniphilus harei]|uniref:hypothetical protein n=1 Tax=Peptoniphilus harei TaxID=54005 RepID=UPI001899B16B|nr:hypothetical protein [Peptoniphilus harei]